AAAGLRPPCRWWAPMIDFDVRPQPQRRGHSGCSSAWLERYVRVVEAGGSNPLTPTVFSKRPFGERVEGLSYFRDKSCACKLEIQTGNFKQPTLRAIIRRKPFLFPCLRTFKRRERNLALLCPPSVVSVDLDRESRDAVAQFRP